MLPVLKRYENLHNTTIASGTSLGAKIADTTVNKKFQEYGDTCSFSANTCSFLNFLGYEILFT